MHLQVRGEIPLARIEQHLERIDQHLKRIDQSKEKTSYYAFRRLQRMDHGTLVISGEEIMNISGQTRKKLIG